MGWSSVAPLGSVVSRPPGALLTKSVSPQGLRQGLKNTHALHSWLSLAVKEEKKKLRGQPRTKLASDIGIIRVPFDLQNGSSNCLGMKRMLTYLHSKTIELSSSSSKDVFILVHSEQKQCEDNLIQDGGGGGGSSCLSLTVIFFKFTIRNCIEFVFYLKMKTLHEASNWQRQSKVKQLLKTLPLSSDECPGPCKHLTNRVVTISHLRALKASITLIL